MSPTLDETPPNDGIDAIQEHPEPLDAPDQPYGERNVKLPQQLIDAFKAAVKEAQGQEMYIRRREVIRDRTLRFYERGNQHVYPNNDGFFFQAIAGQASPLSNGEMCPTYIGDFPIFNRFLQIQIALLSQNLPGTQFQPIDPNLAEDKEAASTAQSYSLMFDRSNSIRDLEKQIVRMFGVSSRCVIWTRTEANAQKWGLNDDGTARRMEVSSVYGSLESKVPIMATCQDRAGYVFLYDDPDVKEAKGEYPEFADKIHPNMGGLGENAYERNARLGILQGTRTYAQMGDGFTHLCTRINCWLRPWMFNSPKGEEAFEESEDGMTVKEKILQLFPDGVHVVFVGDQYVGSWSESMDDAVVIGFPYEGDGMFRQALMDCIVIIQDTVNDLCNAFRQCTDEGWPSVWTDADQVEYEAIREQVADPYSIRQKKSRSNLPLADSFYREPEPEIPESFFKFLELCRGDFPEFMVGTPPAVFGAAMANADTASAYAQARAQALGQQGTIWAEMQRMFAMVRKQAALAASRNPDHAESITVPGGKDQSPATIVLAKLTKGKFGAFADPDSSFPESTAQKRQALNGILQQASLAPSIATQINESPRNWKEYSALNGFPDLEIPEANSWEKQEFEIEQLLRLYPIKPSPQALQAAQQMHAQKALEAEMAGAPVPPFDPKSLWKCSISAERFDFHSWEFAACKNWLSSASRRQEMAKQNFDGITNVQLHCAEHEQWMVLLAPPPPPANVPPPKKPPEPSRPAPPPPPPPVNPAPVIPQAAM